MSSFRARGSVPWGLTGKAPGAWTPPHLRGETTHPPCRAREPPGAPSNRVGRMKPRLGFLPGLIISRLGRGWHRRWRRGDALPAKPKGHAGGCDPSSWRRDAGALRMLGPENREGGRDREREGAPRVSWPGRGHRASQGKGRARGGPRCRACASPLPTNELLR